MREWEGYEPGKGLCFRLGQQQWREKDKWKI